MASGNKWLGKIKSGAKSMQEAAKTRLEKVSETLDKKIKEAQEDLEKQRLADAPGPAAPRIQRWRPSIDNPDGEIVAEAKPPPIEPPIVQPPSSGLEPLSSGLEPPAPEEELFTVTRKSRDKRRSNRKLEQKDDSVKQKENLEESNASLDSATQQTIDQEVTSRHSNESNVKISTGDEFLETTILSQKDELLSTHDLTNHPAKEIDIGKEELTSSQTALNEDITQPITSNEPLIDRSTLEDSPKDIPVDEEAALMNIDDSPVERSSSENMPLNESNDEPQASMNIGDLSTVDSKRENIPTNEPNAELANTDNSTIINSGPEEAPADESSIEQPALPNMDDSFTIDHSHPENIPVKETTDKLLLLTNTDDSAIEHVGVENIQVNKVDEEQATLVITNDSKNVDTCPEHIPTDTTSDEMLASIKSDNHENEPDDKSAESAEDDDLPIEHSSLDKSIRTDNPDDNSLAVANIDNSTEVHDDLEGNSQGASDDDVETFTNTIDTPDEHHDLTSRATEASSDEQPTLPVAIDLVMPDSDSENIPQETSNDELSTSIKSDHSPAEHTDLENVKPKLPDDEPFELINIDDVQEINPDPENISQNISTDEFLASTESDESSVEDVDPQSMQTDILDNRSTILANVVDLPPVDSNSEKISQDTPNDDFFLSTKSDESSSEDSDLNDILPTATSIDHPPKSSSNLDNILANIPDDALPTTADIIDSSDVHSDPKDFLSNISDDELPSLTNVEIPSHVEPNSANILTSLSNDDLSTIEDVVELPPIEPSPINSQTIAVQSDSENTLMNIPDDALPPIEDIPIPSLVNPTAESILMSIPDDELPTLTNINQSSIIDSVSETTQIKSTDETVSTLTNVNEEPLALSAPENHPVKQSTNNEVLTSKPKINTSPNELEDSFEELKTTYTPVHRVSEKPANEITHLDTLRTFLSRLDYDDDDDDDDAFNKPVSFKSDDRILEKSIPTAAEPLTTPRNREIALSLSSSSSSDGTADDVFNDTPAPNNIRSDEPSIDGITELISTVSIDTKTIEKKRSLIVKNHSIPPDTKIQHITCSSTYIYFCTTDQKIFYAKLNVTALEESSQWQQHIDLADQLAVSVSNQTVWRLHNKTLYIAIDPGENPPIGSQWNKMYLDNSQALSSISINDQYGWCIKDDGTLWLLRNDDRTCEWINVACPFTLSRVSCFEKKVGVTTSDGEILIRAGFTNDAPEGGGWIFIEHNFGPIDDFIFLTNDDVITIVDKNHHLWMHQFSTEKGFYEILCDDDLYSANHRSLVSVNLKCLCFTDCETQIHTFSDCLTGVKWIIVEENTRLQRLIGAFSDEDYVWALTADRRVSSSKDKIFEKPRQAQYLTHATFVPHNSSQSTVLWSLDESCGIYVRPNLEDQTEWEQANQIQFEWSRRLVNIVCNSAGVWAVDDHGCAYFRYGHISASQNVHTYGSAFLPPAWISVPGEAKRHRFFVQIFCGPIDWMVYATDNKQNVYTRVGINEENRVGTAWKAIEDCSALELAISEHTLWLLTSCGEIQCRENISLSDPIGTRSTTLSGFFRSLTVSMDDSQVWALDSNRNLMKLDRLTVLFEK